jgi:hypothetical protein
MPSMCWFDTEMFFVHGTQSSSKMYLHTEFGIQWSNNTGDMVRTSFFLIEVKGQEQGHINLKVTVHHPKMFSHTEFRIPRSNNTADMPRI